MKRPHTPARLIPLLALFFALTGALHAGIQSLHAYPPDVELRTNRARQSVVVQAVYNDSVTRDVTARAEWKLEHPEIARLDGHVLHPLKDGETTLTISFEGYSQKIPVKVVEATQERPISFNLDVMPIFMRADCNTGGCHGSARGQDGFMLSLFGYDPKGDYQRLTTEYIGRRVNLARPEESLMILKSIGAVPHTGGKLFEADSEYNQTLLRWLQASAPKDPDDIPTPVALEIYPTRVVLQGENATQQMTARARYSNGTTRDVTSLAVFFSSNDSAASVSRDGLISAHQHGEAFVMARFATFTEGSQVLVIPSGEPTPWPESVRAFNYIDDHIHSKLSKLRIIPSELSSDEVFMRRVFVDVVGQLPSPEETRLFLDEASSTKRADLVSRLLQRKDFVEMWVMKWSELLQIRSNNDFSYKAALQYYNWLRDRIAANVPINEVVRELLSSSGGNFKNPATNYYQIERDTLKTSENVAQVFMGIRMQCAQCHNHPFDRWTMDDYFSFAAFFGQIGRKGSEDPRETIVYNRGNGEIKHPVDNRDMKPVFLGGTAPEIKSGQDRRAVMADWLVSPENPYFARNLANMIWAHFFGQGIIDPVDDVRISNPPSNPELLDALAAKLIEYNYDFRKLVFDITTSRTYQLSTQANPSNRDDTRNFARGTIRRIRAEVLLDCISQATRTKDKFRGLPLGAKAVQIADGTTANYFLTTFGRARRDSVCSCEVVMEPNLSQALHLLNGETVHNKVRQGGLINDWMKEEQPQEEFANRLFMIALSRTPNEREMADILAHVNESEKKQAAWEDVFWALLNSKEFIFNH